MKELFLIIALLFVSLNIFGQTTFEDLNYIENTSFEIQKPNSLPINSPNGLQNSQAYKLDKWKSRVIYEVENLPPNQVCCFHSPDWNKISPKANVGAGFLGMGYYEMIEQKMKNKLTNKRELLFTAYVRNYTRVSNNSEKINLEVLFGTKEMKYDFESINGTYTPPLPIDVTSCSNNYKEIKNSFLKYDNKVLASDLDLIDELEYYPISFKFNLNNEYLGFFNQLQIENLDWISINQSSHTRCSGDYIFMDDISIIPAKCNECPVAQFIQDETYSTSTTIKAQNYIVAGSHIKPPINGNGSFGEVNITNGSTVMLEALNSITLKPGVNIENGSDVQTVLQTCVMENDIEPLWANAITGMSPNGDGTNDDFVIFTNATEYVVYIYQNWGENYVEEMGVISSNQADEIRIPYITDDWGKVCTPAVYTWFAYLSNCKKSKTYSGNVTAIDVSNSNCNSAKRKDIANNMESVKTKVYPNPVADFLTVDCNECILKKEFTQVFDINGKEITIKIIDKRIDVSHFSTGIYFLTFLNNEDKLEIIKFTKE